jgi:radical SAM protein with 4Fe4S-binding SPASM domain
VTGDRVAARPVVPLAFLGEARRAPDAPMRAVPHIVAWNLTARCNLECAHCYIAAGPAAPADGELTTDDVCRIADEIFSLNPAPMFILSGGEPLLRRDLPAIAEYGASRGATVVVGTNGTLLSDERISELKSAGVTGVAVSVESLDPHYHDRFRRGHGSLGATLQAVERLAAHRLDFVIQTTVTRANRGELPALAAWAAERGAVSFNAYFLVTTGRATRMSDLTPAEYEDALEALVSLHLEYLGRMLVRAKCAPHFMRLVHRRAPDSPLLNYGTRCPCGVQYCRITPDGKLTACPYLPLSAGDVRTTSFVEVWQESSLFNRIRAGDLGGKCGRCEYRVLCGGCRARAYAADGDALASDPSCAYEPPPEAALVRAREVVYGSPAGAVQLPWSADASARLARIPSFVRGVVLQRVETYAREHGCAEVTLDVLREVRARLPVDFSKRLPFFSRHDD